MNWIQVAAADENVTTFWALPQIDCARPLLPRQPENFRHLIEVNVGRER
jgi:hypothetical protein